MKQGTTPTICIETDTDLTVMDALELAIKDSSGKVFSWGAEQLEVTPSTVALTLSQEETFALQPGYITIQMRAKLGNDVIASDILRTRLEEIIAGEVEL